VLLDGGQTGGGRYVEGKQAVVLIALAVDAEGVELPDQSGQGVDSAVRQREDPHGQVPGVLEHLVNHRDAVSVWCKRFDHAVASHAPDEPGRVVEAVAVMPQIEGPEAFAADRWPPVVVLVELEADLDQ
jgi:hypothetical protein